MTTIVISPATVENQVDGVVQIQVTVKREDFEDLFDQIEVWRSRTSVNGPYEELTAATWRPARIPKTAGDVPSAPVVGPSFYLATELLQLRVNENTNIDITFSGPNPVTASGAAAQLNGVSAGRLHAYVDATGTFVLETTEPGTTAMLRVVGGGAAALLGLPMDEPDSFAYGKDPRISLDVGTEEYTITDTHGSSEYFYKTRFRNRLTGALSAFSQPYSTGQVLGVTAASVVVGYVDLVDLGGKPLANRSVSIYNMFQPGLVEGKFVASGQEDRLTDVVGHVEFTLVRGTAIRVAIAGTDISRGITVPTDTAVKRFNLLSPSVGTDDAFVVQVPQVEYAHRRSP